MRHVVICDVSNTGNIVSSTCDTASNTVELVTLSTGLILGSGLLLYLTAVRDEVGQRKEDNDDAHFIYNYGWGFHAACITFLCSNGNTV